ncbi:MAG: aldehyde ferredoxin oxidoreductase family protein [Peptococcales bacterium]|jgi:aldehyde:ferredoxin oxidoreductase
MDGFVSGKILHVDLTEGKITVEKKDELFYRKYLGGKGIALYYLLKKLKSNIDPLSPDNILVVALSVLTGAPVGTVCRYTVAAKSPLTGAYGESEAGGFFAPELKFAGFDGIVIKGKADHPVYLSIINGEVKLCDARHIWGKVTGDTQDIIREELGITNAQVLAIGPAGENQVRYACILNELGHANGRTGLGAVMGSKNLKAIVVKGNQRPQFYNKEKVKELAQYMAKEAKTNPLSKSLYELGTGGSIPGKNTSGMLPTSNFSEGEFAGFENISGLTMKNKIQVGVKGCWACPIRCKRVVQVDTPLVKVESRYGGPEYETLASFGSLLRNDDLISIAKAHELCNKYSLDTISTGVSIAFVIECFEKGFLTKTDTQGLELKYGDSNLILKLIEMIAYREGIGNLLAEGVRRISEKLGSQTEDFAMEVKGQEIPMHDIRGRVSLGYAYALSPIGADHLVSVQDTLVQNKESVPFKNITCLGILEPLATMEYGPQKVRQFYYLMNVYSLLNTLCICNFGVAPRGIMPLDKLVELVHSVTGWKTSLWELLKSGERTLNMARMFNAREGLTKKDDTLPERFFQEMENGRLKGLKMDKEALQKDMDLLYEMLGWDVSTGNPKPAKLYELGLDWIVKEVF